MYSLSRDRGSYCPAAKSLMTCDKDGIALPANPAVARIAQYPSPDQFRAPLCPYAKALPEGVGTVGVSCQPFPVWSLGTREFLLVSAYAHIGSFCVFVSLWLVLHLSQ